MSGNTYNSPAGRINEVKGEMLKITEPVEVLSLGCSMKPMPKNKGDNITFRGVIPTGGSAATAKSINRWSVNAADFQVQEGVTPAISALEYRDVNVAINQYAVIFGYTDKTATYHEDDIPADQVRQTALGMGLVREMVRYGVMKAATNVQYSGGTTRATVDEIVTYNGLSLMAQTLNGNGASKKTSILAPGPAYDTSAIQAGYVVFHHTDVSHDIRRLEDFVPTSKYGNRQVINEHEIGAVGEFRFIQSKELSAYADAGAAVAGLGLYSTTGTSGDVYPMIICGEDAVYDVALNANFDPFHLKASMRTKEDPLGQRGYVGASFWSAACVVNNGHMGVIEVARTSL